MWHQVRSAKIAIVSAIISQALNNIAWVQQAHAQDEKPPLGFSISVDGEHVAGDPIEPDTARKTDLALSAADIRVTYDGLNINPKITLSTTEARGAYRGGEPISFRLDTNYWQWIDRAEIRIFTSDKAIPIAVIPVQQSEALWHMPVGEDEPFSYVGRVYDTAGRYDETKSLVLDRTAMPPEETEDPVEPGRDVTARRTIPLYGGSVTVQGHDIPPGGGVQVGGTTVPIGEDGSFVYQQMFPSGDHMVEISLTREGSETTTFRRAVNIPTDEWFYVGMADLTTRFRWGDGEIIDADTGEYDKVYLTGRTAFYLKGKIKGQYLVTASADTGEGRFEDMVSGVLSTDPQSILRRIDPNEYYPVYGDDSQLIDDAPTRGKLYVRIDRGASHVMWGTFRTEIGDSSFMRTQRTIYGAAGQYQSDATTAQGAPLHRAKVYAAQPGTLAAHEVFRGTGGSAYVLRRQDVVPGSENITIETRNAISSIVTSTRALRPGLDYSINYLQGLVILSQPLSSSQISTGAVQSSYQDTVNLVVRYEHNPIDSRVDDYAFGCSASTWLNEHVRVGVTAAAETSTDNDDVTVAGGNLRLQQSQTTFIEAEVLRSHGQARSSWYSSDGGFTFIDEAVLAQRTQAYGYRLQSQADFKELLGGTVTGDGGLTVEYREAGFTTFDRQVLADTLSISGYSDLGLSERLELGLTLDAKQSSTNARLLETGAELRYALNPQWDAALGLLYRDERASAGSTRATGDRTDLGMRLTHKPSDDWTIYGFGQATVMHSAGYERNDRIGLGTEVTFAPDWSASVEGSLGTSGPQALTMLNHRPAPGERTYIGLRLTPDIDDGFFQRDRALDGIVAGAERRLNDTVSVFAENTYGLFDDRDSLARLYGITYDTKQQWSGSATYESGTIVDDYASDFERHALSVAINYAQDGIEWTNRGELRLEDSDDGTRDRQTYLYRSGLTVQVSDNWRALGGLSALVSQSDQTSTLDGDYIEATIGAAYRPVDADPLKALFRYTYLYDLPGADQVTWSGSSFGPAQRSHIFSVDADYALTPDLTVGAKYGFRIGEVSDDRSAKNFTASSAHLGILRADWKFFDRWSWLAEVRTFYHPNAKAVDWGALAALSYDINDTVRLGVGYNFGKFSDDLRDLTHDDHGVFLNLLAKF